MKSADSKDTTTRHKSIARSSIAGDPRGGSQSAQPSPSAKSDTRNDSTNVEPEPTMDDKAEYAIRPLPVSLLQDDSDDDMVRHILLASHFLFNAIVL